MAIIPVPKPLKTAMNPGRPVSALLLAQVQHLQHAERRLPLRYRTEIYTHAIRTEGEVARYIREVTEAIHQAHADAEAKRTSKDRDLTVVGAASGTKKSPSKAKGKIAMARKRT